jgi:hypothetical protein
MNTEKVKLDLKKYRFSLLSGKYSKPLAFLKMNTIFVIETSNLKISLLWMKIFIYLLISPVANFQMEKSQLSRKELGQMLKGLLEYLVIKYFY